MSDASGAYGEVPLDHAPRAAPIRIGDELIARGLLTESQLNVALAEQRRVHRPLGDILMSLGFVRPIDTARILSEQLDVPLLTPRDIEPEAMILATIDMHLVRRARAFPISLEGGTLRVAMVDPTDPKAIEAVRGAYPYPLSVVMVTSSDLDELMRQHGSAVATNEVAELLERGATVGDDRGVEELTEAILRDGIRRAATDIHVQPEELITRIRYRIDGVLRTAESLPHELSDAVVSRLKISARLDIAERRRPQDGRLRLDVDGREVDLRVSVMPNVHGENVVLRILDRSAGVPPLEALGVEPDVARHLARLAQQPHGLFLVTGPTGSGKTTTLYSLLARVDSIERNVSTIEDPVEYSVPLVRQSQVDMAVGYGFHEGLRALLRQDPDVILVGEIRDEETADMAIKASMTGHLVLATLHTTDALGAISRLVDLGVPSYLLEETLLAVMGQRLVRRLCDRCAQPLAAGHPEYEATAAFLEGDVGRARAPVGCPTCDGSGFSGRMAVAEVFVPTEATRPSILAIGGRRADTDAPPLEVAARRDGYDDLGVDAARKVRDGATTLTEVLRIYSPAGAAAADAVPRSLDPTGPDLGERGAA